MLTFEQKVEKIKKVLKLASDHDCLCFLYAKGTSTWGYILFPDKKTIMYVQNGYFWGYDFSIQYIPSRQTGSGCSCHGDNPDSIPESEITWEKLVELKAEGLRFARELRARMYNDSFSYIFNLWCHDDLQQVCGNAVVGINEDL